MKRTLLMLLVTVVTTGVAVPAHHSLAAYYSEDQSVRLDSVPPGCRQVNAKDESGQIQPSFVCRASYLPENQRPREFPAFRGTWILDEPAGRGGITGVSVAQILTIITTPTEISITIEQQKAAQR